MSVQDFPPHVLFVRPSINTFWGHISLVEAELAALEILYDASNPDWFVVLSAADYQVMPARKILANLYASDFDAYVDCHLLAGSKTQPATPPGIKWTPNASQPNWIANAYQRYFATRVNPDLLEALNRPGHAEWQQALFEQYKHKLLVPFDRAFPEGIQCFSGDHWISGNRNVAERLLAKTPDRDQILDYFGERVVPDEAVYQTILCNSNDLKISRDNLRFADWSGGGAHPKTLDSSDLPNIIQSQAHFARKFAPGSPILDTLDELVRD